jgi:nucleoid-associated protein YgaU
MKAPCSACPSARCALRARSSGLAGASARRFVAAALAVPDVAGAGTARARTAVQSGTPDLLDTVQPGDTLIGIASRLLESTNRWQDLQRPNRIEVPRRLEPGRVPRIRPEWVRADPAPFAIRAVGGSATLDGAPARA